MRSNSSTLLLLLSHRRGNKNLNDQKTVRQTFWRKISLFSLLEWFSIESGLSLAPRGCTVGDRNKWIVIPDAVPVLPCLLLVVTHTWRSVARNESVTYISANTVSQMHAELRNEHRVPLMFTKNLTERLRPCPPQALAKRKQEASKWGT